MERSTVEVYEAEADRWVAARDARRVDAAERVGALAVDGLPVLDVGCGPGGHFPYLEAAGAGGGVVGVDAALSMLRHAPAGSLVVQADLMALPFGRMVFGGVWARMSYHHVPRASLPLALAHLHWSMAVGAPLCLVSQRGATESVTGPDDEFPGRFFACWEPGPLRDVLIGAGFDVESVDEDGDQVVAWARRARTLPDTVGAGMRLLVCGLNPAIYAADRGAGFARRSNRFWPAMIAAGVVSADRAWDPFHLLAACGIGMTDLVKRATVAAAELSVDEYRAGVERVSRLVSWLRPGAVLFVGLDGWRRVIDRRAVPGWQPGGFGGVPAYVMPSTSGLNASSQLPDLVAHLRAATDPPPQPEL